MARIVSHIVVFYKAVWILHMPKRPTFTHGSQVSNGIKPKMAWATEDTSCLNYTASQALTDSSTERYLKLLRTEGSNNISNTVKISNHIKMHPGKNHCTTFSKQKSQKTYLENHKKYVGLCIFQLCSYTNYSNTSLYKLQCTFFFNASSTSCVNTIFKSAVMQCCPLLVRFDTHKIFDAIQQKGEKFFYRVNGTKILHYVCSC